MTDLDTDTAVQLEAAAFRRLLAHLRERTDVQNIELMNLAGFCRNCLSNWYQEAAAERRAAAEQGGRPRDHLRHALRGMAALHQSEAAPDAQAKFAQSQSKAHKT